MKRHLRTIAALALVACIAGAYVIALADTLATNEKPSVYRFNATYVSASGTTTYMDSLKNIRAYPIGEDTTSNGKDCYWIGTGRKLFGLQVDSTDVFKFYETTGPDTAVTGMDSVLVWTTIGGAPEGFISSSRAFGDTVIASAALKASAVTTARIADSAIDSSKIAAEAVQTTDLASDAVTAAKLADGAVADSAQMAAGVVSQTRLADDAVVAGKLADGAVADSAQLGAGVVTVTRLASDAVTSEKIADGAIADSSQLGTGVVTATKLAASAVTEDKIADGSVSGSKLSGGTMASGKIYYATSGSEAAWKDTLETSLYIDNIIMAENAQFGDGYITMNGGKVLIDGDDGSITGEILHAHGVVFHIGELTPAATFQDSLETYCYREVHIDSLTAAITSITGPMSFGDAAADTLTFTGTVGAADAKALKIKNQGGTGITTVVAPRVTGSPTAVLPIGGRVLTAENENGVCRAAVYVQGMTNAGRVVASAQADTVWTSPAGYLVVTVATKVDSLVFQSYDVVGAAPSAAWVQYLYWK